MKYEPTPVKYAGIDLHFVVNYWNSPPQEMESYECTRCGWKRDHIWFGSEYMPEILYHEEHCNVDD